MANTSSTNGLLVFGIPQSPKALVEKAWFFQTALLESDKRQRILWDTPSARVPLPTPGNPAKVKIIVGPTRFDKERHLPSGKGTNWGPRFQFIRLPEKKDCIISK